MNTVQLLSDLTIEQSKHIFYTTSSTPQLNLILSTCECVGARRLRAEASRDEVTEGTVVQLTTIIAKDTSTTSLVVLCHRSPTGAAHSAVLQVP